MRSDHVEFAKLSGPMGAISAAGSGKLGTGGAYMDLIEVLLGHIRCAARVLGGSLRFQIFKVPGQDRVVGSLSFQYWGPSVLLGHVFSSLVLLVGIYLYL